MKWMMTLTTLSLLGIGITGNSIYSEVKLFSVNPKPNEISASMYRSLIWHIDVYGNAEFEQVTMQYLEDGKIDIREYAKLTQIAKTNAGPIIYLQESQEQLWHARLTFKKYMENKIDSTIAKLP